MVDCKGKASCLWCSPSHGRGRWEFIMQFLSSFPHKVRYIRFICFSDPAVCCA